MDTKSGNQSDNNKFGRELNGEGKYPLKNKKEKEARKYEAIFKGNRTFEITISRQWFRIVPRGKIILTKEQIDHADFQQQKKYFVVKEL